jgi:hypothetical protein
MIALWRNLSSWNGEGPYSRQKEGRWQKATGRMPKPSETDREEVRFRDDRRSEQAGESTALKQLASIARRQIEYVRSQIKLLAGDCGVWFEFAPI